MHTEVLKTCSGVDGRTIEWELDLTALKQIKPLTDTKQHHLWFSFLHIKNKYILFFIVIPHFILYFIFIPHFTF